jgi:NADPH:quinone reductase-like Zn-dependent oxidoreductase
MKALIFNRYGKRDNLTFAEMPQPVPKSDEILVEVHAVGLNPIDYMIPKGTFKPILKVRLPVTLGSDVAGVVVEVGSRVTRFKPGDAIFASVFDLGTGTLADYSRKRSCHQACQSGVCASSLHPDGGTDVMAGA